MADAWDLKSLGLINREGSTPSPRNSCIIDNIGIPEYENFATTGTWLGIERSLVPQFSSKRHSMDSDSRLMKCNEIEKGCSAREQAPMYFDTTVNLQKTKVHYTRLGTVVLTQGKNKITVDVPELEYITRNSYNLINRDAQREVERLNNKAAQIDYLREALKKLENEK